MNKKRRLVSLLPWLAVWIVLLTACIAAVLLTRASYTDSSSDQDALRGLRYQCVPYSKQDVSQALDSKGSGFIDADDLVDSADTIVECEFDGQREYSYQAFLSKVVVSRVIKGDPGLTGKTVPVYEPVSIARRNVSLYSPEVRSQLSSRFGYAPNSDFYQLEAKDAYAFGTTMMAPSGHYVLFLDERRYPVAEDRTGKAPEYVLCTSPYAKLSLGPSQKAEDCVESGGVVTLSDTLSHEILAADPASAQDFLDKKDKLLQQIGEGP